MRKTSARCVLAALFLAGLSTAEPGRVAAAAIPLQPLAQQVRLLETALSYLGQPLGPADHQRINRAIAGADEAAGAAEIEAVLDQHALLVVEVNPESRVKVTGGPARPELVEGGTRLFLVKVVNEAGVTAPVTVKSPNSGPPSTPSRSSALTAEPAVTLTLEDVRERWADIALYQKPPMREKLTGLGLEYQILQVASRDRGKRSAQIGFSVGQGTQDIGFRNDVLVLFDALPAHPVTLKIRDESGQPALASLLVRDGVGRIYPSPAKRLAPDFPFQEQVYRADGETLLLPPGSYTVTSSRGPEYLKATQDLRVEGPRELAVRLERWIDPAKLGWYSGDHHIHAAGCAHYDNPTQGVSPKDMWRQVEGEALNVGSVLTWGPCYYHQKRFFSGGDRPGSRPRRPADYHPPECGLPP